MQAQRRQDFTIEGFAGEAGGGRGRGWRLRVKVMTLLKGMCDAFA